MPLHTAWALAVLLLSLRLAAVFLLTPILGAASVSFRVRVPLTLGLSAALAQALPGAELPASAIVLGGGALFRAALGELALGATLALGIQLAFAAFSVAGQLLGIQIGFGMGRALDPASNTGVPLLVSAFDQLAVVAFFGLNGHHALLRGVALSLRRFPLGEPWPLEAAVAPVLKQVAGLLGLGFALAAPVVLSILLAEMALAVLARNLPQVNMLAMGIPAKVVLGLVALSLWVAGMGGVMTRAYAAIFRTWEEIFAAAAGVLHGGVCA